MIDPLVSIIIPTYNSKEYISDALTSAWNQTYSNIEVIVVDNGSIDGTIKTVTQLIQEKYPKTLFFYEEKKGAPHARNLGLNKSKGKYIQFLDSDDILWENKIKQQLRLLSNTAEEIDIIAGSGICEYPNSEIKKTFQSEKNGVNVFLALAKVKLGTTSTNLFLRESIVNIGGWDTNYKSSQEYKLMFDLLKKDALVCFDSEPLCTLRQVPNSISRTDDEAHLLRFLIFTEQVYTYMISQEYDTKEMYDYWFWDLRRLFRLDRSRAIKTQSKYLKNYRPKVEGYNSALYVQLFSFLGFKITEWIYTMLKR